MSTQIQKNITNKKNVKKYLDFTFENLQIEGYEAVYKITNEKENLLAIISMHDVTLGTALGGTRIKSYKSFNDALTDALRLSKGMSYKAAISEVGLGGGKSVIIVDDIKDKNENLLKAFGKAVDLLEGKYICAEDMGCTPQDVEHIHENTKYVVGLPTEKSSGNPSRFTSYGVVQGIKATLKKLFGTSNLKNRKIAIQGLGSVGELLIEHLFWAGADLIVSDIDMQKAKSFASIYGAIAVEPEAIHKVECDIFTPCAIGGTINDETIDELNCKAVCGAANNQLLEDRHADILKDKNILYAPDFVVNAGGLINVSTELEKDGYHPKKAKEKIYKIYNELLEIYKIAEENNISTNKAAIKLAQFKMKSGIGRRKDKLYFHHSE
ncbi:MAG: Leucine dehydrogenase [Candidatus Anoxychlamydiales bacterium]|nr:Leucine dehydrogenase [Candidatus Anoxychlamydiales bacterium]